MTLGLAVALAAAPAAARDDTAHSSQKQDSRSEQVRDDRDVGDTLSDAWLVTKVKAQFWDEDALDDSDINVDAVDGVITLRGTVASQAGRARALAIARGTEGVKRVEDRLSIGMAARDDDDKAGTSGVAAEVRDEAKDAKRETRETTRKVKKEAREIATDSKEASKEAARDSKDAVATAGEAVTDGWITAKVKSTFIGEDALENSDIDVDTNDGVVTLAGTVRSQAGRARAEAIAKKIEGVRQVRNEIEIGAEK
jgi:hyperosmotically inducible protein